MVTKKRIVVIGRSGQIGFELVRALSPLGELIPLGRSDLDLLHPQDCVRRISELRPDVLVNAAAWTSVDDAENQRQESYLVNAETPVELARYCAEKSALFVHYSTDYVFSGKGNQPWLETDSCDPINWYGSSKRKGEEGILAAGGTSLILRTSWVYGARGNNFLFKILALAKEREQLKIVDDQVGCPTSSRFVAYATAAIVTKVLALEKAAAAQKMGLYHLTASESTTWYGFAKEILKNTIVSKKLRVKSVSPCKSSEFPAPAKRPQYSVLDCRKIAAAFDIYLPSWREQLRMVLEEVQERDV